MSTKKQFLELTACVADKPDEAASTKQQHNRDPSPDYEAFRSAAVPPATPVAYRPHQRQGDRGSGDDAGQGLRRFVRFADLVAAGIVGNWVTLNRLIDVEGFPPGILLGRNTRAWSLDAVHAWLDSRPTVRKPVIPSGRPRARVLRSTITTAEGALTGRLVRKVTK